MHTKIATGPDGVPPRLALVLGSGGVRSAAALGIADVLAREGVHIDLLVGCSSGALFGAVLAMGMKSADALALATRLWSAELTEIRRWRAYAQLIAPRWFGFDENFSLRDATKINMRINEAFGTQRLESLPTPLRVVTTDLATGDSVVLTRGSVAEALRASIALPLIFPSVEIEGRRLADGVVCNPLPVSVACDARSVIALGFRGALPRRINRASRMVGQVTTAMINNLQQAQLTAAQASGLRLLNIELDIDPRIGLWQTSAMPGIFEAGQRATERQWRDIKILLDTANGDHLRRYAC